MPLTSTELKWVHLGVPNGKHILLEFQTFRFCVSMINKNLNWTKHLLIFRKKYRITQKYIIIIFIIFWRYHVKTFPRRKFFILWQTATSYSRKLFENVVILSRQAQISSEFFFVWNDTESFKIIIINMFGACTQFVYKLPC